MKYWFLFKPVFFIISLLSGTYLILYIEKLKPSDLGSYGNIFEKKIIIKKNVFYPLRLSKKLSPKEIKFARIAWKYFENNYHDSTGFVNSLDMRESTNFRDMTSYLMGMISAYEIGIIDKKVMDVRFQGFLKSLSKIKLYKDILPNKLYNPQTLQMQCAENKISGIGIGWSAIDIGRFFSFVHKIRLDYPQYFPLLKGGLKRWKIENMIENGYLFGIIANKDKSLHKVQECTLGYEEYCSIGLLRDGYDVNEAMSYVDFIKFKNIYDIEIGVDTRETENQYPYNYLLSDPYLLEGIEYGWNINSKELAYRIYQVQKERYHHTQIITAVSEDIIDSLSARLFYTIHADGKNWKCLDEKCIDSDKYKTTSTKAAFAWYVLFKDDYSEILFNNIQHLYDPQRGWYSGRFENTGLPNKSITCYTNGLILEALNYKVNGKIIRF